METENKSAKKMRSRDSVWRHGVSILFLAGWLGFYLFTVTGYTRYPWWHRFNADSDNVHAVTTLAIVNGGEFQFIYHPGATVHQFHGVIYQGLALLNNKFRPLLQLAAVRGEEEAIGVLSLGTRTSRTIVFPTMIIFEALMYFLFFRITSSRLTSCLMTFYIFSSQALLMYAHMIRPEPFSLIYFLLAYYLALGLFQKNPADSLVPPVKTLAAIGFCLGYAVFSKIQIGPAVVVLVAGITYFWQQAFRKNRRIPLDKNRLRWGMLLGGVNIIVFPWWTLHRPGFLTRPYLDALSEVFNMNVFGPAPENFLTVPFVLLLILAVWSGFIYFGCDHPKFNKWACLPGPAVLLYNSMAAGLNLAVYSMFLPVSRSFSMYLKNTNNMVYGSITNSLYGKWLLHPVFDMTTFQKIYSNLNVYGCFLNVNLFTIIFCLGVWSLVRLLLKSTHQRGAYGLVLGWFLLGLLMDILGTMRSETYFNYYMLYPVCFYGVGMVHFIALELNQAKTRYPSRLAYRAASILLIGVLAIHSWTRCVDLWKLPRATGQSDQDPSVEYSLVHVFGEPFWKAAGLGKIILGDNIRGQITL